MDVYAYIAIEGDSYYAVTRYLPILYVYPLHLHSFLKVFN